MTHSSSVGLDQRLRLIEDRLEIYNLIASHPPSADTGAGEYTATVWTEDGVFDRGAEFPRPTGRAAIAGGSSNPEHHRAIEQGIAHFAGLPYVELDGDRAAVTSYLQILMPDPNGASVELSNHGTSNGFRIHRVAVNRWDLVRTEAGWKIKRRTLRPLDGSEPARQILRQALKAYEASA